MIFHWLLASLFPISGFVPSYLGPLASHVLPFHIDIHSCGTPTCIQPQKVSRAEPNEPNGLVLSTAGQTVKVQQDTHVSHVSITMYLSNLILSDLPICVYKYIYI